MQSNTNIQSQAILEQALELCALDRAAIIEGLVSSLDQPDSSLDNLWLQEAKQRMKAYKSKQLTATDASQVFSDLGQEV